jgi:hypothetical protein
MTVKELKNFLEFYDENLPVFLRQYKQDCRNAKKIFLYRIKKDVNLEWQNCPHELNNEDYDCEGVIIE